MAHLQGRLLVGLQIRGETPNFNEIGEGLGCPIQAETKACQSGEMSVEMDELRNVGGDTAQAKG
jgi:hypothetical protein